MLPRIFGKFSPDGFRALLLGAFLFGSAGRISAAESTFDQANRLYEQGKYSDAAALYENIIKTGRGSAPVFFNLGNAWFKDGKLGRALYHYRIAAQLTPRDPDIQANLRFTRERVPESVSLTPSLWDRAVHYFTVNELAAFLTLMIWCWAALFSAGQLKPELKPKLRSMTAAAGIFAVLTLIFLMAASSMARRPIAISIAPQGKVHLGPLEESQVAFPAPDGSELAVLAERGDWIQVSDRNNRSGWIPRADVLVFPPGERR